MQMREGGWGGGQTDVEGSLGEQSSHLQMALAIEYLASKKRNKANALSSVLGYDLVVSHGSCQYEINSR